MGRGRRSTAVVTGPTARAAVSPASADTLPDGITFAWEAHDGADVACEGRLLRVIGTHVYARQDGRLLPLGSFGDGDPRSAIIGWHEAQRPGLASADHFDQPLLDMLAAQAERDRPSRPDLGSVLGSPRSNGSFERARVLEERDFGKAVARRVAGDDGQRYVISSSRLLNETIVAVDHGGALGTSASHGTTLHEHPGVDAQAAWRAFTALDPSGEIDAFGFDDDLDDLRVGEAAVAGLRTRLRTHVRGDASAATVAGLRTRLRTHVRGDASAATVDDLRASGLVDADGTLTDLGRRVEAANLSEALRDHCLSDTRYDDLDALLTTVGYVDATTGELSDLGMDVARSHGWARKPFPCSWCGSHACDLDCVPSDDA